MALISERFDSLETIGDRRMYLSTMSLCAGYAAKCLIFLERHSFNGNDKSMNESMHECKAFIDDLIASLEGNKNAPLGMLKLADFLAERDSEIEQSVQSWREVSDVLSRAEKGEKIDNQKLRHAIVFLRVSIDTFNEIRKRISERINAPLFPREYL
jgi:hypothetical protein